MLVVLAGDCLAALQRESDVLQTLKKVCDRIAMTERMERHHTRTLSFSAVRPVLADLEEFKPPKVVYPHHRQPVGSIPGLRSQHDVIFKEALAVNADYLITERDAWLRLADQHSMRIVTPAKYVAERTPQ